RHHGSPVDIVGLDVFNVWIVFELLDSLFYSSLAFQLNDGHRSFAPIQARKGLEEAVALTDYVCCSIALGNRGTVLHQQLSRYVVQLLANQMRPINFSGNRFKPHRSCNGQNGNTDSGDYYTPHYYAPDYGML